MSVSHLFMMPQEYIISSAPVQGSTLFPLKKTIHKIHLQTKFNGGVGWKVMTAIKIKINIYNSFVIICYDKQTCSMFYLTMEFTG